MKIKNVIRMLRYALIPIYLYLIYFVIFLKNAGIGLDENWLLMKYWEESFPSIIASGGILILFVVLTGVEYLLRRRECRTSKL